MSVLIVGGSLCGITFALACAKQGIGTRVVERAPNILRNGGTLAINRRRLLEVVGVADDDFHTRLFPPPVGDRRAVSWHELQNWLVQLATKRSEIVLESGVDIEKVSAYDTYVTATTSAARQLTASLIVGADGQCSTIRRAVDPEYPFATYAGYMLWRGLIPESTLPVTTDCSRVGESISLVTRNGHRLVAFPVANSTGSTLVGERMLSFVWYDPSRFDLLRDLGCIDNCGNILRPPRPGEIPSHLLDELSNFARRQWPEPWRTIVTHSIAGGRVSPLAVGEYYPRRLCAGRVVLIGDASHVASPVTERGFATGIEDAAVLAALLAKAQVSRYGEVLEAFERARLPAAQALVSSSRAWSRKFVADPVRASSQPTGWL